MPDRNLVASTILVADDNESNAELLSEILQEVGYRTICVRTGSEALSKVTTGDADLAVLDVRMPDKSGFEVCSAIKSNPSTRFVPVILVTGLSAANDRIQGIVSGADDFLNKPVNQQEVRARVKSLLRLKSYIDELEHAEIVLTSLAASIEAKDPYTAGHCERLSNYSVALGKKLGLSDELCVALRKGGIVHDIGKVAVPERILLKPERLTPEEWYIMKQHPAVGERICAPLRSFRTVLPIIRHHHEKLDGTGYPDGLKGDEIPLTARVLQTVDIYDALTTDRPYRPAMPVEEALETMRSEAKRGWWDHELIDEFEALVAVPVEAVHGD
ncbi:MAG TPA: HD domain-containing phosphohydrolase [Candidatus Acidoferrum sp.]|jgi:putative two-component system response regulator